MASNFVKGLFFAEILNEDYTPTWVSGGEILTSVSIYCKIGNKEQRSFLQEGFTKLAHAKLDTKIHLTLL
jgi:hypothetical protein